MLKQKVSAFIDEQIEAVQKSVGFNIPVLYTSKPRPNSLACYLVNDKAVRLNWMQAYNYYINGSARSVKRMLLHEYAHHLIQLRLTAEEKALLGAGHNAVFMVLYQLLAISGLPDCKEDLWWYEFSDEKLLTPVESLEFFEFCRCRLQKYNGPSTVRQIIFLLHAKHHWKLESERALVKGC